MFQPEYIYVILLTILANIPFGYLRGNTKRFSLLWFLYIHLPVPLVIFLRNLFEVELTWSFAPVYFGAYLFGQWIGKKIFSSRRNQFLKSRVKKSWLRPNIEYPLLDRQDQYLPFLSKPNLAEPEELPGKEELLIQDASIHRNNRKNIELTTLAGPHPKNYLPLLKII
jgi:hypothetical protein